MNAATRYPLPANTADTTFRRLGPRGVYDVLAGLDLGLDVELDPDGQYALQSDTQGRVVLVKLVGDGLYVREVVVRE